ncbi:MAG: histidine kinase dimerization/phospho-acceptor domain-containing protein [Oceanicaulis sp.]
MGFETDERGAVAAETRRTKRRLVARSALRAVPLNLVNAALLSVLFFGHVDAVAHGAWFAVLCLAALLRLAVMWRAHRADRVPSDGEMLRYIILSGVVGVCWGATPFLLGPGAPAIVSHAVAMVIAGMAAGAAMTSAAEHRVVLAYTAPALGLWGVSLALTGSWQGVLVAIMLGGFFLAMNSLTMAYSRTLSEAVKANVELDEARRHTEAQAAAMSRLAEHNDKAARRAEEQARASAAVLANMSHELRAPLNGVLGMAQLLEETVGGGDQRRMAQRIRESGEQLNRLLTDVLDVSRIEAGRLELQLEDVTARSLADEVRARFEPQAAAKGLAFEVQIAGEAELALRADEDRLMQLTRVFVANAIRFTDTGGVTAAFTTRLDESGAARLRLHVRDTGCGVPESARAHLFDALASDMMDSAIREAGTGLGLHLAKRLAQLMDGDVGYQAADPGSEFWFEVGLKPSRKADKYADGEQLTVDARRLRMLVAETDPARRSVLLGYLKSFNCVVTCAASSQEMLDALEASAYDAVVLGLEIGGGEAEDAAGDIRSLASTAAMTPVIRLARDMDKPVQAAAMETLVRAPVSAGALLEALNTALASDSAALANLRRIA